MATKQPLTRRTTLKMLKELKAKLDKRLFVIGVGVEDVIHETSGLRMSHLMAIHEFGAPTKSIPARAPFGKTMARNRAKYTKMLGRVTGEVIKSGRATAARQLGATLAADVQSTITSGLTPPLKPRTVAAKGSSKPLIDTGVLRQSITYEVVGD